MEYMQYIRNRSRSTSGTTTVGDIMTTEPFTSVAFRQEGYIRLAEKIRYFMWYGPNKAFQYYIDNNTGEIISFDVIESEVVKGNLEGWYELAKRGTGTEIVTPEQFWSNLI
jgi:hypothetical protein